MKLEKIRKGMETRGIDCLVITETANWTYTIEEEASGYLFITQESIDIVAPNFYRYQLEEYDAEFATSRSDYGELLDAKKIEGEIKTDAENQMLEEKLGAEKTDLLEELRKTKDEDEVEKIREACKIADEAVEHIREKVFTGMTEFEAVAEINRFYAEKGVREAFLLNKNQSIVQRNGLEPHAAPTTETIQEDDLVIVDTGARKDLYCSDTTRTFCRNPSEKQLELFETVRKVQEALLELVEPGKKIEKVRERELELVEEYGFDAKKHSLHSTGHGVGVEVHEKPSIATGTDGEFDKGMVVTVEPGLYVPGTGGVRIEDTVLVTSQGAERLNSSERKL